MTSLQVYKGHRQLYSPLLPRLSSSFSKRYAIGNLYYQAATIRDNGRPVQEAVALAPPPFKAAIRYVYARPDMTPEQWRWFVIGVCVAEQAKEGTV